MTFLYLALNQFFSDMFESSSAQASEINRLFLGFLVLSAIILGIVAFMVIGGIVRYRESKRKGKAVQTFGNKKLEIVWTVIPLIIVTVLFVLSLRTMQNINSPIPNNSNSDIEIIAHQWWWEFRYPESGVVAANELHIPVNKKLLMSIKSADVIHSWWVPALGRKIDAVPGYTNHGWLEPDSIGVFTGTCSEYCGMQHTWMRIQVVVESQEDYDKWIKHQQQDANKPTDDLAKQGEMLFQQKTCGSCHSVSGTEADGKIGPDLSHVGSRETLLSGLLYNNKQNMRKWIEDPQKVKSGSNMPNFLLSENEVNAITDYLEQLK